MNANNRNIALNNGGTHQHVENGNYWGKHCGKIIFSGHKIVENGNLRGEDWGTWKLGRNNLRKMNIFGQNL